MFRFSFVLLVLGVSLLFGCGEKEKEPVAANADSNKPAAPPEKNPVADTPLPAPNKTNPPKGKNPPNKKPEQSQPPATKEPAFVKPKPGFNPVKLPNVPDAPKGFAGKSKPDDAEIPVEAQQKLNGRKPGEILGVLKNSQFPKARERAADDLDDSDFKEKRGEIILALRGALRDSRPIVVIAAMDSLRHLQAYEAAGDIVGYLYHPNEELSNAALNALEEFGPEALPVIDPLVNAVRDPNFHAGFRLYHTIEKLGPGAAPHVLGALKQKLNSKRLEDGFNQQYVCEALGGIGAEQELLDMLNIENPDKHLNAARGAAKLPKFGPEITARMVTLLKNGKEDESTRAALTEAVGKVRPYTPEVLAALAKGAEDQEAHIRRNVSLAFISGEPRLPEALPIIQKLLKDSDEDVRQYAGQSVKAYQTNPADRMLANLDQALEMGNFPFDTELNQPKAADEYLATLQTIINDAAQTNPRRGAAVIALQELRFPDEIRDAREKQLKDLAGKLLADEALSVLIRVAAAAIDDEHPQAATAAVAGLANAESKLIQKKAIDVVVSKKAKAGIPGLIQLATASDNDTKSQAIEALRDFGPDAAAAVPTLVKILEGADGYHKSRAISALQDIASQPEVCLPALEKVAYDKESDWNDRAAKALCEIVAKSDKDPLPTLKQVFLMISQIKPERRAAYIEALGLMGPKAAPTVGRLIEFLADKDEDVRRNAAVALGNIGPAAKAAAVPLVNTANTDNHDRRWEITTILEALGKIKSGGPELAKAVGTIAKNKDTHYDLIRTLTVFGPEAAAAVPALVELLPKLEESQRRNVWDCFKAMGPAGSAAAPAIQAWIPKLKEEFEREDAQAALKAIKP